MATPSTPGDSSPNHMTASTKGGASSVPTPANNVGGGKGWGDKGFTKGGTDTHGPGHIAAQNPQSSFNEFLGLRSQKGIAGSKSEKLAEEVAGHHEHEDHSFMEHKPGCPETLPGWSKTKNVMDMLHRQGT